MSARDWDDFDRVPRALKPAKLSFSNEGRRATLGARLQGYGVALVSALVGPVATLRGFELRHQP